MVIDGLIGILGIYMGSIIQIIMFIDYVSMKI